MESTNLSSDRSCLAGSDSGIDNYSGTSGNSSILLNNLTINTTTSSIGGSQHQNHHHHHQQFENSEATSATLDLSDVQEDDDCNLTTSEDDFKNDTDTTNNTNHQKRISTDSGSTFEIIDHPTDCYDDSNTDEHIEISSSTSSSTNRKFPKLDLEMPSNIKSNSNSKIKLPVQRQDSRSSSKTCEADVGEERDTFSPISNNGGGYLSDHLIMNEPNCSSSSSSTNPVVGGNGSSKDYTPTATIAKIIDTSSSYSSSGSDGGIGALDLTLSSLSSPIIVNNGNVALAAIVNPNSSSNTGGSSCTGGSAALTTTTTATTTTSNSDIDNKIFEKKKIKSTSTKEEKQRQNEEIVIMETSSVSSETGSWESVFPHRVASNAIEVKDCCHNFLENERRNCDEGTSLIGEITNHPDVKTYLTGATTATTTTACFIDASSLLDESEMIFTNLLPPQLPEVGCRGPKPPDESPILGTNNSNTDEPTMEATKSNTDKSQISPVDLKSDSSSSTQEISSGQSTNLDKLEAFFKSFEMCKPKVDYHKGRDSGSNSSSCSGDSPRKGEPINKAGGNSLGAAAAAAAEDLTNNLSDEEKIWKRKNSKKSTKVIIKDQFNKESPTDCLAGKSFGSSSNSSNSGTQDNVLGRFDAEPSEGVQLRKDQERKQGKLVFENNIQQFSGHIIEPKLPFAATTTIPSGEPTNFIDFSSSPAPSLAWSDLDTTARLRNYDSSSNYGDTSDFGDTPSHYNPRLQTEAPPTCILPGTPHNSIVQIGNSNNSSSGGGGDPTGSRDTSLQYFEEQENVNGIRIPPKKSMRRDESAPIVSGGASIKDFTPTKCESPTVRRKTESCPIVSGGFVSLDFQRDDELDEIKNSTKSREKPRFKQQTWVVDMSDCSMTNKTTERRRSTSSSSSAENTARSIDTAVLDRSGSGGSQRSGMGFYVSLSDMDHPPPTDRYTEPKVNRKLSKSLHDSVKKSTGFYVDLSESENSRNATPPLTGYQTPPTANVNNSNATDKKNIFSMFIDFGEKKSNPVKREPLSLASRLSNTLYQKRNDDPMKTSDSSQETLMSGSQDGGIRYNSEKLDSAGETMAGSSDESRKPSLQLTDEHSPPVAMRRTVTLQKEDAKRHSWNNCDMNGTSRKEHKRSSSFSSSCGASIDKNIMNILDKIPLLSKTSSMSIDSSLSPYEDFTCSKSEMSTYSNNSGTSNSGGEQELLPKTLSNKQQHKKRRRDVQINETFDKSSQGSITDGVLSKDLSPASNTDTDDLTFQPDDNNGLETTATATVQVATTFSQIKELCRPTMETIIETKETSSPKKIVITNQKNEILCTKTNISATHTMETLHATIEKQKMLLETVNEHTESGSGGNDNFVRLSDLDKPSTTRFELHSPEAFLSKSVGNQRHLNRLFQENSAAASSNRVRPHSWAMTRSTGNNIQHITNSVENLRSLSRLFPHLSKEFSNSLPNDVYLEQGSSNAIVNTNNRSPIEMEYLQSDMSTESSLASSFSRSGLDESSISCRQPRRLGEDLLKMFLQEIATDVIVEVNGRRIKAHKCILRSRCQYFAAMLAGGWVQSAGNVISLQGYSYSAVHFALCHIYSGACHPPDGISLMELAALADLLGLEGLKEVTAHALKSNYCHNFHKPCSGCIDGILQVLPVALNHALDDLYRKSLKWTCRHYLKVWPTRAFAQLPSEIFGRCRQQVVAHLTSETVLESILDCDYLISQLVHSRWAIVVENLVRDILDSAYGYVSDHFASLIASDSFLSLGHDKSSTIPQLECILLRTASSLNPDQACRSYQRVTRLNAVLAAKVIKMPPNLQDGSVNGICNNTVEVEEEMEWNDEFIRLVSAILSAVEQCITRQCSRAMRVTAWQRMDLELRKKIQKLACLTEPLDIRRNTGTGAAGNGGGCNSLSSKMSYTSGNSRSQDLYQVKLAIQAHTKRALAQDTQLYRATTHTQTHTNHHNIQTIEKGVQANQDNRDREMHTGKVMKTNSRAHVPAVVSNFVAHTQTQVTTKGKSATIEKSKSFGHRRTQSEDSSITTTTTTSKTIEYTREKPIVQRLTDIRPRYLEPRKTRALTNPNGTGRPLKTLNNKVGGTTAVTNKNKQMSSSDSSRTSSPAAGRKLQLNANARKIGTKSINMSLDSLASPSKRSTSSNPLRARLKTENEISVDSLAGSMRSSMKTEKTISQESLIVGTSGKRISRSNPGINKVEPMPNILNPPRKPVAEALTGTSRFAKNKSLVHPNQQQHQQTQHLNQLHTAGSASSPSSVITNKSSSRLSSVSSLANSPRDAFKNRSVSVPASNIGNTNSTGIRKSFLSAKSREILAKRAAAEKTTDSAGSSDIERKSIENNKNLIVKSIGVNKSVSASNIPTRMRPVPPSTLHLKKKITMKQHNYIATISPTKVTSMKITAANQQNQKRNGNVVEKSRLTSKKPSQGSGDEKSYKKIENNIEIVLENMEKNVMRIESKLERSSTFCKEVSDLPVSELQVID